MFSAQSVMGDLHFITPEEQRSISQYTVNKEDLYITLEAVLNEALVSLISHPPASPTLR